MTPQDALLSLKTHRPEVVAIGASAGGLDALQQILPQLPGTFTAAIVVVLHLAPDRPSQLRHVFLDCALRVEEIDDKAPVRPGIYFAPPDYHVLVERTGTFALANDEALHFSRPSIDVLFDSVAASYRERAMGILLSGASVDGAAGLRRIRDAGGLTWVQTPASADVSIMPEAALALAPHPVLTPADMGRALAAWGNKA
jgi:two-component system chemotaxis response regulator CheB